MTENEHSDRLSELSDELLERIVGKLDVRNRTKLRKVSKKYRDYIDGRNNKYDRFEINISDHSMMLGFDNTFVTYDEDSAGECQLKIWHVDQEDVVEDQKKKISGSHYYEIALNDLAIMMKSPKVEVKIFIVTFDEKKISDYYPSQFKCFAPKNASRWRTKELFKSLKTISQNSLLHANCLDITSLTLKQVPVILSFFKPATLEKIFLETVKKSENDSEWDSIRETDQWKQARRVDICKIGKVFNDPCRLENLHHLAHFYIHLTHISPEDVIKLRDALSKSNTFEYCKLIIYEDFSNSEMGRVFGAVDTDKYIRELIHRHPILNSNEFLEFKFERGHIIVEKKRESSQNEETNPFLKLSDDVIGKIIDNLEIKNRFKMRKVCRKFRSIVDNRKIKFDKIAVTIPNGYEIIVQFDDIKVHYIMKISFGCLVKYENTKTKVNREYQYVAIDDLASVLMNPNIELARLHVDFRSEAFCFSEDFCKLLKYISPLSVKFVYIHADKAEDVQSILSCLKPGTLERMKFKYETEGCGSSRILTMEQWKQAKTVDIDVDGNRYVPSFALKYFTHFTRFNVRMDPSSAEELIQFRDDLSKSANFKYGELTARYKTTLTKMRRAIGGVVSKNSEKTIHRHPIPGSNSNEYLEITIDKTKITFEKKH